MSGGAQKREDPFCPLEWPAFPNTELRGVINRAEGKYCFLPFPVPKCKKISSEPVLYFPDISSDPPDAFLSPFTQFNTEAESALKKKSLALSLPLLWGQRRKQEQTLFKDLRQKNGCTKPRIYGSHPLKNYEWEDSNLAWVLDKLVPPSTTTTPTTYTALGPDGFAAGKKEVEMWREKKEPFSPFFVRI